MEMESTPPNRDFLRTKTSKPVTIEQLQGERVLKVKHLKSAVAILHPILRDTLKETRERACNTIICGELPNVAEGDFVLMARDYFTAGEKSSLRWRGPWRVIKALSYYVFQVEDFRPGLVEDVHGSRFKFCHNSLLFTVNISPHAVHSETIMPVQSLMCLEHSDEGIGAHVR